MAIFKDQKQEIIKKYQRADLDTGSTEVQVALLSFRIRDLTDHFKKHKKDVHGRRGLLELVNRRKKLLSYLRRTKPEGYTKLITELDLRK